MATPTARKPVRASLDASISQISSSKTLQGKGSSSPSNKQTSKATLKKSNTIRSQMDAWNQALGDDDQADDANEIARTSSAVAAPHHTTDFARQNCPWISHLVQNETFELVFGFIIMYNCITIGIDVHLCPPEGSVRNAEDCPQTFLNVSEHICTGIFVIEFLIRTVVLGFAYHFQTYERAIDAMLVWVVGVGLHWVLGPMMQTGTELRMFTALRAFRLLRLLRLVRHNPYLKEAWLLLSGLASSLSTLFSTILVILFVQYLFGILAVTMIGDSADFKTEEEMKIQGYFSGLDQTFLTLLQVMTGDAWVSAIARPVIEVIPHAWILFVLYIAVGTFVLLNLITAVIVENALQNARTNEEEQLHVLRYQKQRWLRKLQRLFQTMDTDDSGELTESEFQVFQDTHPDVMDQFHLLGFDADEVRGLFRDLDNGDGVLYFEEFIGGLHSMEGVAMSKDLIRTQKSVERLHRRLDAIFDILDPEQSNKLAREVNQSRAFTLQRSYTKKTQTKSIDSDSSAAKKISAVMRFRKSIDRTAGTPKTPTVGSTPGNSDHFKLADDATAKTAPGSAPLTPFPVAYQEESSTSGKSKNKSNFESSGVSQSDWHAATPAIEVPPKSINQELLDQGRESGSEDALLVFLDALQDQLRTQLSEGVASVAGAFYSEARSVAAECRKRSDERITPTMDSALRTQSETMVQKIVAEHLAEAKLQVSEVCKLYSGDTVISRRAEVGDHIAPAGHKQEFDVNQNPNLIGKVLRNGEVFGCCGPGHTSEHPPAVKTQGGSTDS